MMSQFEFVDPEETIARQSARGRARSRRPRGIGSSRRLWREMQDLPRHLGQHSGGMVVCQGRLDEVVPLENASMPGRVVVQWDKDDCADLGIVKVDLLGLGHDGGARGGDRDHQWQGRTDRHLTSQRTSETREHIRPSATSVQIDLAHLPPDDPAVYRMLQQADTIGVFQVESRAQMATLPRLQARALLRPRRRGRDHPARADRRQHGASVSGAAARRRAGDVSRIRCSSRCSSARWACRCFRSSCCGWRWSSPDFSGGEAEELRRAMGFKRSVKRMQQIEARLRDGHGGERHHRRGGRSDRASRSRRSRCTDFPSRTRPASRCSSTRARISRRTIPAAFYTALLNNQPMGFYSPGDARQGRAAARRAVRADRRAGLGLELRRAGRTARSGWGCGTCTGCARRRGKRIAGGASARRASRSLDELVRARRPAAGRSAGAGGDRRARGVRRRPPNGAVAGGAGGPAGRAAA